MIFFSLRVWFSIPQAKAITHFRVTEKWKIILDSIFHALYENILLRLAQKRSSLRMTNPTALIVGHSLCFALELFPLESREWHGNSITQLEGSLPRISGVSARFWRQRSPFTFQSRALAHLPRHTYKQTHVTNWDTPVTRQWFIGAVLKTPEKEPRMRLT